MSRTQTTPDGQISIRCGSCKGRHGSKYDVRECYDAKADALQEELEAKAERLAEDAWLRHAEGFYRLPDQADELDRLTELYGYGPPA